MLKLLSVLIIFFSLLQQTVSVKAASGGVIWAINVIETKEISQSEAESFVRSLSNQVTLVLNQPNLSDFERVQHFRKLFESTTDVDSIGRLVLGRYWYKATEVEKLEFLSLFKDITTYTWAQRLKEYTGHTLTVTGVKPRSTMEDEIIVESTVNQQQGKSISILWKLHRSYEKRIRITDLVVEGISMIVAYRSEYGSVIQRSGGEISGLLLALRNKVSELRKFPIF